MNDNQLLSTVAPRWSHGRILFSIEDSGMRISCSISKAAIQDASGDASHLPQTLMRHFTSLLDRITVIAISKLHARGAGNAGVLHIWSDDLNDDPPPTAAFVALAAPA